MRFETDRCHQCGKEAAYILESMLVHYWLERSPEGQFDYSSHSEEWVETSEPVKDPAGRITLGCEDGHEWQTAPGSE